MPRNYQLLESTDMLIDIGDILLGLNGGTQRKKFVKLRLFPQNHRKQLSC